jgi:hypothetical protein
MLVRPNIAIMAGVLAVTGCGHSSRDHQAEVAETMRKVRMREVFYAIAVDVIENPGIQDVRTAISPHGNVLLNVPDSDFKFVVNTNITLWRTTTSAPSHQIAIYFADGKKYCGLTFDGEFVDLDPGTAKGNVTNHFTQ